MAAKIDLTWVDPALQEELRRSGLYLVPQDEPFCGHPQVLVAVQGQEERMAWVDAELAPVFRWCWRSRIRLSWGCEGRTERFPWTELGFDSHDDVVAFLDRALPYDETSGSRYDIALGRASREPENVERRWHLATCLAERVLDDGGIERVGHGIDYFLRIPPPDLTWLADLPLPPPEPVSDNGSGRTGGFDLAEAVAQVDLKGPAQSDRPTLDDLLQAHALKDSQARQRRQARIQLADPW